MDIGSPTWNSGNEAGCGFLVGVSPRSAIKSNTCIHHAFDLTKDPSDRLADNRNNLEQVSFANENVLERLVDPNELS